jgi:hypothetical protein
MESGLVCTPFIVIGIGDVVDLKRKFVILMNDLWLTQKKVRSSSNAYNIHIEDAGVVAGLSEVFLRPCNRVPPLIHCKKFTAGPSSRRRGGPISKHINGLGMNKNLVVCPDWAQNHE